MDLKRLGKLPKTGKKSKLDEILSKKAHGGDMDDEDWKNNKSEGRIFTPGVGWKKLPPQRAFGGSVGDVKTVKEYNENSYKNGKDPDSFFQKSKEFFQDLSPGKDWVNNRKKELEEYEKKKKKYYN